MNVNGFMWTVGGVVKTLSTWIALIRDRLRPPPGGVYGRPRMRIDTRCNGSVFPARSLFERPSSKDGASQNVALASGPSQAVEETLYQLR